VHSKLKQLPVVAEAGRVLDTPLVKDFKSVRLSHPDITEREIQAVLDVMRTPNLSCGPKIVEFEEKISTYVGKRFAIAVNSGTSGLHLIVRALKMGQGDEVITTPFSFIASSNCLLYENVKPVFVDIDRDTYNIDPRRIVAAITPRTKAILAVDVFGQPARYDLIESIAQSYGLNVISDCCESIGAKHKGRPAGSFGVAGVFGFYPNKQITTGEGGVIVTDDSETARLCRSMRNHGRGEDDSWLAYERLGYNYRLPEISCALGIVQLERIDDLLNRRQRVADAYNRLLSGVEELHLPYIDPSVTQMSWFVYVVRLADRYTKNDRNQIVQHLVENQVGTNTYFPPIHLQPFYRQMFDFRAGDFPITEALAERTIALPFHSLIEEDEIVTVVARLKEALALRRSRAFSVPR
jgi:perosamine synthetase